jgi:uncharacterized protein with von Willebrand factor type A (vWA) domain
MQSDPHSDAFVLLTPMLRLVGQLRDAGVPVSSAEVIDASQALTEIDLVDRRTVRATLATTLIKQAEDLPTFGVLFELHFAVRPWRQQGMGQLPGGGIATSLDRLSLDGEGEGDGQLLDMIMDALRRGDEDALRTLADMAVRRYGALDAHAESSERYFMHRVLRALELSKLMGMAIAAAREEAGPGGLDEHQIRAELNERIDAFKQLLAEQIRGRRAERGGVEQSALALDGIGTDEVDFLGASPRQMAAMRGAIRPLARALATKMARRRRRRDRGRLDLRRTVRRSLSFGGVLMDPAFRRPKVARPDLYVLCDVSGSVAEFASFTLTLLQAMSSEFPRMRSFAFVDGVDEVTQDLKDVASFPEVRHILYRADVIRDDGHSDYGAVFERFWDRHGSRINSRSTIIITGDARSNHRAAQVEGLRSLHARARKVYLFNPEPEDEWDTTDSIVSMYEPGLDGIFEVRNLRQLAEAVYRIT